MTQDQKVAGALVAVFVLFVLTAYAVWLAVSTCAGAFLVDPESLETELKIQWRIAKFFMELGTGVNLLLAGVITIVTTATAWITEVFEKRWQLTGIILLCVTGLIAIIYTLIDIGEVGIPLIRVYGRLFPELSDPEAIKKTADAFLMLGAQLIAVFSFFLASRLGIEKAKDSGPLRKFLKKILGEGGEG